MDKYTVNELAKIANVSVRTLHHYDEIDLLKPSSVGENGYRYYGRNELVRLMQIVFYKELNFSLKEIRKLLKGTDQDKRESLLSQKELLKLKRKRLGKIIETIDLAVNSLEGGENMSTQKISNAFSTEDIDKYKDEVKARWGHTDAYRQSMERYQKWSKEELEKIKKEGEQITRDIASLMGKEVSDSEVQSKIKSHHQHINRFYDCSMEMYQGLGKMYFDDPRFAKYYNDIKPGLAEFMRDAIAYYTQQS